MAVCIARKNRKGSRVHMYRNRRCAFQKHDFGLENSKAASNIHLIFGTREESGILYRDEFETLARMIPGFSLRYQSLSGQSDWAGW
ncbi:MAG: hypothetical protein IPH31_23355 [Lewinellaceae bacterium]|nr:hypothetical protein [Lewinellaceae bacterium]